VARRLYGRKIEGPEQLKVGATPFTRITFREETDLIDAIRQHRQQGVVAQPNHVLFAHVFASPVYGSPVYGSPLYGSPLYGSPLYGSPVYGSPVYGSPLYGSPLYGSPLYGSPFDGSPFDGSPAHGSPPRPLPGSPEQSTTGIRRSTAVPSHRPTHVRRAPPPGLKTPKIVILDTGLAVPARRPPGLDSVRTLYSHWEDEPKAEAGGYLDPAVGHGTFIAGLINRLAPGCEIIIAKVLSNLGDGNEWAIADIIQCLPKHDLLNLSFGGYTLGDMNLFATALAGLRARGTVVVASAGNDATQRPCYPAAFDDVIGVAALGPSGPAVFSNYGDWVQACAPGVDLVSTFFTKTQGPEPAPAGYPEPDKYKGWACWSGTSFSAPVVVAALAREMQRYGLSSSEAVARVIDAPGLFRIPSYGTVVNLQ
jgi:hypothetical protein